MRRSLPMAEESAPAEHDRDPAAREEPGRRHILRIARDVAKLIALAGLGLFGLRVGRARAVSAAKAPPGQEPLRPPGALPEDEFRAACIRCQLCAQVCPPRCIQFPGRVEGAQPDLVEAPGQASRAAMGEPVWAGDDTPYILPWQRACTLCMQCTDICPTHALRRIPETREAIARDVRMGVARIDRKICLPWNRLSWCGACFTVCPYREHAITTDHQNRPTVDPAYCVGCGLCVEVCPIKYKAIAVAPPYRPDRGSIRPE